MKSIVGKVINSKIIKKSNKGDWYVLESPIRNRNIFLHISNWNSNPNLNEGDYLAVYVVGFDGNKNRYNGSLKTKDSIYSLIDQIESTMLITSDEKNALLSLDYSSFVEQIDRLRDFLLDLIGKYRNATIAFESKNYEDALDLFEEITYYYNSKYQIEIIRLILEFNNKMNEVGEKISSLDFLKWIVQNKRKLSNYIHNLDEIVERHKNLVQNEIEASIESQKLDKAVLDMDRLIDLFGETKEIYFLKNRLNNAISEKKKAFNVVDEKGFYQLIEGDLLSEAELEKYNKFFMLPYYKYSSTTPDSKERCNTSYVLKAKSGEKDVIQDLVEKLHYIIPNVDVVLCFVPSSEANRKYYTEKWDESERKFNKTNNLINPPFADVIYCLSNDGNSYNRELSQKTYQKINDGLKRIDGSTVLKRMITIKPAHEGGLRSKQQHMKTIKVINPEIIRGKEFWLLDYVVTTCSSLYACDSLLMNAGAKKVRWLAIGKTTEVPASMDDQPDETGFYFADEDDLPF